MDEMILETERLVLRKLEQSDFREACNCLLKTSDAAGERSSGEIRGLPIIKKKKRTRANWYRSTW